jgi:hypothetical protein
VDSQPRHSQLPPPRDMLICATLSGASHSPHGPRQTHTCAASVSSPSTASHHLGWSWECIRCLGCTGPAIPPVGRHQPPLRRTGTYCPSLGLPSRPSGFAASGPAASPRAAAPRFSVRQSDGPALRLLSGSMPSAHSLSTFPILLSASARCLPAKPTS